MVSLINMQPIEYPRNALLDFSPINSAIENYQQQQIINRRLGMENERLGFERERQGFARDLHPLQTDSTRLSVDAARQGLEQNRLRNPWELRQIQAGVLSAEDTLRETMALRRDLGGGNPTPESARGNTYLTPPSAAPSTQPMPGVSMSPPRQASAPAQSPAAAPPQPQAHDFNELGPRFVRDHILSVSPEVGQARFGMLLNDPVFGPALREHGLHEMDWREAAGTMAGIATTPPTAMPGAGRFAQATSPQAVPALQPLPAPQAPQQPPAAPAQPPAAMSDQERTARRMIASGLPQYVTQGRQMLEEIEKGKPENIIRREAAQEQGKLLGQATANLPTALQAGESILRNIDAVMDERGLGKALPSALGGIQSRLPTFRGDTAAVESRLDQLQGQAFLQAFERLRGAGQISEGEGKAATIAFARLANRIQDPAAYRLALEDARREVHEVMNLARQKAGQPLVPFVPSAASVALRTNPQHAADFDRKYGTPQNPNPSRQILQGR